MYENPNLFGLCKSSLKSAGDEKFFLSVLSGSSFLLKVFNFYLNITFCSRYCAWRLSCAEKILNQCSPA